MHKCKCNDVLDDMEVEEVFLRILGAIWEI